MMSNELHIINHSYHASRIKNPRADLIVIGNNFRDTRIISQVDLFEPKPLYDKLFCDLRNVVQNLSELVVKYDKIYFWGMQDIISYKLACKLNWHGAVYVVPDNIEFFLRYYSVSKLSLRLITKSIIYKNCLDVWTGSAKEFCGRFTYDIPHWLNIDHNYAFYSNSQNNFERKTAANYCTFISQPYYLDQPIDEREWAEQIVDILNKYKETTGEDLRVKYHQRDTQSFRRRIEDAGFEESSEPSRRYIGVFSTLLFEMAVRGFEVRLVFDEIRHLFPAQYCRFVDWLTNSLAIDANFAKHMCVTEESFSSFLISLKV